MFKSHPKGLIAAALSNMGERFGYYIMNAVMTLFLCSKFGLADETASLIYAIFMAAIYAMSLVGGLIADKKQNYKGTIQWGLMIMAAGYVLLSIPIVASASNNIPLLIFTCFALVVIAFGNGLFKGNLQAIVGQMYDNFEADAAKKGEDALRIARSKRDSGFQIFYVFINIGGLVAPFVAPLLRNWLLSLSGMVYNAKLPALCHQFLENASSMNATDMNNLTTLMTSSNPSANLADMAGACSSYLEVFNTGIHYSFIASVIAMLISLVIFLAKKYEFPVPAKKVVAEAQSYSAEEKSAMAKEIEQRLYALFAVLGVCVFFWFSFHQNTQSLTFFANKYVNSSLIPTEIWQAINPFFVIVLTPIIMFIFGSLARKGKEISTPKKIAYGMGIAGTAYLFLMILSIYHGYPNGYDFTHNYTAEQQSAWMSGPWVMIVTYFFLTVAELFISPLGLSFVSKVAPKHLQGICQGLWLAATGVGNILIVLGTVMLNNLPKLWMCWAVFLLVCVIAMGVMFGMLKWLERIAK